MEEKFFLEQLYKRNTTELRSLPDKEVAEIFITNLFNFLFGSFKGKKYDVPEKVEVEYASLKGQLLSLLFEVTHNEELTKQQTKEFFAALPSIYAALIKDANTILEFDPAAESLEEVIVAYPGFYAIAVYRLSNRLWKQNTKILPRLFSEYAHSKTGIDIHPGATIGHHFFIDHGTGVVIGETTVIGNNVKVYQSVTLGALNVAKELVKTKRHPTIQDNVIIYSGATILGGDTLIGHDSVIGGNVWLTYSVPSFSIVYHKSEIKVRDNNPLPELLNFVI